MLESRKCHRFGDALHRRAQILQECQARGRSKQTVSHAFSQDRLLQVEIVHNGSIYNHFLLRKTLDWRTLGGYAIHLACFDDTTKHVAFTGEKGSSEIARHTQ